MSANFKMISLNVRGLRMFKKRRAVFTWFRRKKADVIFVQESHSTREDEVKWKNEWGADIFFSHGKSNARGAAILLRNGLDYKIINSVTDSNGRFIMLLIEIQGVLYKMINVYAPDAEGLAVDFFEGVLEIFEKENVVEEDNLIIGGDFNCVLNPLLDKRGGSPVPKVKSVTAIGNLQSELSLDDIWRIRNPTIKAYTWSQSAPLVFCRLDYWLISHHLQDSVKHVDIQGSIKSDHSAIFLEFESIKNSVKGPGFWKLSTSLLEDENFIDKLKDKISEVRSTFANVMEDKRLYWEWLKYNIRDFSITFSKMRAKERKNTEVELENQLKHSTEVLNKNPTDANFALYNSIKAKLDALYEYKAEGIITRSRVRWYEKGEKNTQYFLRLQKRNFSRKTIRKLRIQNIEVTDPHKILQEQRRFYQTLYQSRNVNLDSQEANYFFSQPNIPRLSDFDKQSCEGELTINECKDVLKTFDNGKTPGNDGLPIEFYKTFWDVVGKYFVECMNYGFNAGEMTSSQKQAIITLIDKKGKDREYLENWRPISLVNVDVKIASKVIAHRIKKILPDLIHYNQTAYVNNRYIGDTVRSLMDIMNYTKEKNIPGLFLFLDFKKAFDSLEWNYLLATLEIFNFGPDLLNWIKMFYKNISSCVINEGLASTQFKLSRGVRQGDPLSPYLLIYPGSGNHVYCDQE